MSWEEAAHDAAYEDYLEEKHRVAYEDKLIRESLENLSLDAARSYLGRYGDAVDERVRACFAEAEALLTAKHFGPALSLAATALELMIRFLVLRPLVQGAFLSEEWADILARRVATGRSVDDRKLLPQVLEQWGIHIDKVRTSAGVALWEFVVKNLWPHRDTFVHRYEAVERDVAATALECVHLFRQQIVEATAAKLGFSLPTTGKWAEIRGDAGRPQLFRTASPFTEMHG